MSSKNMPGDMTIVYNSEDHYSLIVEFVHEVEKRLDLPHNSLFSKSRERELVDTRFAIFMYLKNRFDISLERLGAIFNRNHATVLCGLRNAKDLMEVLPDFKSRVKNVERIGIISFGSFDFNLVEFNSIPQYGWRKETVTEVNNPLIKIH